MTNFVFANNASTTLAAPAASSATTLTLASDTNFPSSIPSGFVLPITLNDAATRGIYEICYVTAISGATLTVTRAQEGTVAQNWGVGDFAFVALTAGVETALGYGNDQTFALDTGTANTYVAAFIPALTTDPVGVGVRIKIANPNTGASTLDIGGGAKSIVRRDGSALIGNELLTNMIVTFISRGSTYMMAALAPATSAAITAGTDTQSAVTPAQLAAASSPLVWNALAGLTLSAAGGTGTFGIASGMAADHTNTAFMTSNSAFTKATGAWTAGTGNGALDAGSIAASAWYAVFEIKNPTSGLVDFLITKTTAGSAPAPTLPSGYTLSRYIGSMLTDGSSHWVQFVQNGDDFDYVTQLSASDFSGAPSTSSRTLTTMTLPLGVIVNGKFNLSTSNPQAAGIGSSVWLSDPATGDAAPANGNPPLATVEIGISGTTGAGPSVSVTAQARCRTNTSAQIGIRGATGQPAAVQTTGWTDSRGK